MNWEASVSLSVYGKKWDFCVCLNYSNNSTKLKRSSPCIREETEAWKCLVSSTSKQQTQDQFQSPSAHLWRACASEYVHCTITGAFAQKAKLPNRSWGRTLPSQVWPVVICVLHAQPLFFHISWSLFLWRRSSVSQHLGQIRLWCFSSSSSSQARIRVELNMVLERTMVLWQFTARKYVHMYNQPSMSSLIWSMSNIGSQYSVKKKISRKFQKAEFELSMCRVPCETYANEVCMYCIRHCK